MSRAKRADDPFPVKGNGKAPDGWASAALGDLVRPSPEKIEPQDAPRSRYLSLEHVESGTHRMLGSGFGSDVGSTKAIFRRGDVMYGKLRPYLNKVCIPDFDGICSTDFLVFHPSLALDQRLLMHFLSQPGTVEYANHHSSGVQLPRVSFEKLAALEVPIPPLAEQKRIVAKVEELLVRANAARERLARVPAILKRFRQAALVAACDGRLTDEWRLGAPPTAEPAWRLLEEIRSERTVAEAKSPARRRRHADSDEGGPRGAAESITWEVPDEWAWALIKDLLHYERAAAYGVLQPGSDTPNGVPFVRVCDLQNGTVNARNIKRITQAIDRQYPRTRLFGGEVLVSLVGTIGRIAVAPPHVAGANVARAIGMLPLCPHVEPFFVQLALEHPKKNAELDDLSREVARKTLNLGLLKAVRIPLPPLSEQREIVRRVEALFKFADAVEKRVAAATARAEKLTQAILAKAFRGDLVPTEAKLARSEGRGFEPATELLERVKGRPAVTVEAARRQALRPKVT